MVDFIHTPHKTGDGKAPLLPKRREERADPAEPLRGDRSRRPATRKQSNQAAQPAQAPRADKPPRPPQAVPERTPPAAATDSGAPLTDKPRRRRRRGGRGRGRKPEGAATQQAQPQVEAAPALETAPAPETQADAQPAQQPAPKPAPSPRRKPAGPVPRAAKRAETDAPAHEPPAPRRAATKAAVMPGALPEPPQPLEGSLRFMDLDLPDELLHALADLKFEYCTPIQAQLLPAALNGQDAGGRAPTGTGKTAAFLITIFSHWLRQPGPARSKGTPAALVLAPTRELAIQIGRDAEDIGRYTNFKTLVLYGGQKMDAQQRALEGQVDLVIATPGRLLDFKRRRLLHLGHVEALVIDEADRMLDMGFIPDVRSIIHATPPRHNRQTLLFSATLTPDVLRLASQWMKSDAVTIDASPTEKAVLTVNQKVFIVTDDKKPALLIHVLKNDNPERALIFVNRRDMVERLAELLQQHGLPCETLSGALTQSRRESTLERFRSFKTRILVATDVAGRGLHVDGISHVINFTLPCDPEDYVHRIGRTGRAGAAGTSISFASESDAFEIPVIEEYLGHPLPCEQPPDEWLALETRAILAPVYRPGPRGRGGPGRGPPRSRSSSGGPRRR